MDKLHLRYVLSLDTFEHRYFLVRFERFRRNRALKQTHSRRQLTTSARWSKLTGRPVHHAFGALRLHDELQHQNTSDVRRPNNSNNRVRAFQCHLHLLQNEERLPF